MRIAFFDFDGTLTHHDTFIEFAKFSVGKIAFFKALTKSIPMLCLWKLRMRSNSEAKQTLFSNLFKGKDYEWFKDQGKAFAQFIDSDIRENIMDILNRHKQSGDNIIIVSASIGDWIRPWAEKNGIDVVVATEAECDRYGKLSGRFMTKNCHGEEKVNRIRQLFPQVESFETWGYGDSSGDDAMLSIVNYPSRV